MKKAYNGQFMILWFAPVMQAWRWFRGLFKKKSNGVSLCKSEVVFTVDLEEMQRINSSYYESHQRCLSSYHLSRRQATT